MQKKYMGRSPLAADLVPLEKAAGLLKVHEQTILTWAERGLLEQIYVGHKSHYRREQLESLAPLMESDGKIDLPTLAARADLAYAASRTMEQRLNALIDLLGLNRNILEMDEYSVRNLYRATENALLDAEPATLEDVRSWAGIFFAIDEAYLLMVEKYASTEEPWKKFLDLGYKLVVDTPYDRFIDEPDLRAAYAYLRAARNQLRMVSYFFCRERFGERIAYKVFGSSKTATERILGLLYPH